MKAPAPRSSKALSAREQVDAIIRDAGAWRGRALSAARATIMRADPLMVEEVKWKKPSNPEGVPVWSHGGIVCIGNVLKASVRLTFPKGAKIPDPKGLFNARLDSRTVRAIDIREGEPVPQPWLRAAVLAAAELNAKGKGQD